jgi:hypothetical protein
MEAGGSVIHAFPRTYFLRCNVLGDGYLSEPIYYCAVQYNTSNWGVAAGSPSADFSVDEWAKVPNNGLWCVWLTNSAVQKARCEMPA